MTQETRNIILLAPLVLGGMLAAWNTDGLNDAAERLEAWLRRQQQGVSSSSGSLSKYVAGPLLWATITSCDWTSGILHRGLRNGIRVAAVLYLMAAWLFIVFVAVKIVLILVIGAALLYVAFKVLLKSDADVRRGYEAGRGVFRSHARSDEEDVLDRVGLKGKRVYSGTNWFNEELKGRVDDEGNIYNGTNWFNEERIGRIEPDGTILRGTNVFNEERVGRIDEDGNLHRGANWFNEERTGRIDEHGDIHEGTSWFNEEKKGRSGD